jgi:hypothetical protein
MTFTAGAVGVSYWRAPHPEFARLRRLRKKAGGLTVFGLNDLDLKSEDHRLLGLLSTIIDHRWTGVAYGIMFPEFTRKYVTSRLRFLDAINRFFCDESILPPLKP